MALLPVPQISTPPNLAQDTEEEFSNKTDAMFGGLPETIDVWNADIVIFNGLLPTIMAAATAAEDAGAAAGIAVGKAGEASGSAVAAAGSATTANGAKNDAATARDAAQGYRDQAAGYASGFLDTIYQIPDVAAFEINPANGGMQYITLGASRTPKATNFANGQHLTLMIDDGSARTITWTDATFGGPGVAWQTDAGSAPTLATTGYTTVVLWKLDGQVYGAHVGNR